MRSENVNKIIISNLGQLILGSGEGAIWILKMSDGVPSGSFDDGLMEKTGIPVTSDRPILFVSLSMIGFIFS
jgi:hypothetical protein